MKWLERIVLVLAVSLGTAMASPCVWAGPPDGAGDSLGPLEIEQTLTPNPSHIGDALVLELEVRYPKGYRVNLPTGLAMGKAEVLSVEEGTPSRADTGSVKTFKIHLQAFEIDSFSLPPVMLTYTDPDGQVTTADAPAVAVEVERLTANEAEAERKGEDPPVSLTYPNVVAERVIWAAILALILGAALAALFFTLRRKTPSAAPVIIRPPHELALEALRDLEARRVEMLEGGAYQDFYLELTSIAKQYVQARFGVDVVERTTDELHLVLRREREHLKGLDPNELLTFLREADLIKFARLAPTADETEQALQSVEKIVLQTRPVAAAPAQASQASPSSPSSGPTRSPQPDPDPPEPDPQPPTPDPKPPRGDPPQGDPPQGDPSPPRPPQGDPEPPGPPLGDPKPPGPGGGSGAGGPSAPDMRPGPGDNPFPRDDREGVA